VISFNTYKLPNGLTLIHNEDKNTTLCVCNILYNVGARDENPEQTGFAHLFEHLMFGGSVNIPSFDTPLQMASGENNAFTSNDITNYYITLPAENIETALWLESDRMLRLDFNEKALKVQKGVVIEEFKQRYLNQPYGDAWLKLRPLAYEKHPYQWATIGKEISHIENAKLQDVEAFFDKFYNPSNAIISLAGNIDFETAKTLVIKWFGDIPAGPVNSNKYTLETPKFIRKELTIEADVPQRAIFMAFDTVARNHTDYYALDVLTDMLSGTESSRFTEVLVKQKGVFSHVSAYISGDIDPGLLVVEGKLNENIEFDEAEQSVLEIFFQIMKEGLQSNELEKVKNKAITGNLFSKTSVLNKAMGLCYSHLLGDTNKINTEIDEIQKITEADVLRVCKTYLSTKNYTVLKYQPKK